MKKKIIIAGPCALESREHMMETVKQAKALAVDFVRLSLWKPRTKPGYEGMGEAGIPLLVEAAKMGVHPAVEPIIPAHAQQVADAVLDATPHGKLLLWIGARNQNHFIQREMSRIAAQSERIILMVKNQIWSNEKHWEGIVDHILEGGIKKKNLFLCHRGFDPHGENPSNYRNIPDYAMSMRMKEKTELPMLFDPSHIGGSVANVMKVTKEAHQYAFDGYIVEVHPDPKNAVTDAQQQLTWQEFATLLKDLGER